MKGTGGVKNVCTMVEWGKGGKVSKDEVCDGKLLERQRTRWRPKAHGIEVINNARSSKASLLKANRRLCAHAERALESRG